MIPAITDPLGRHWDQPDPGRILVDDTHALMAPATFQQLREYSTTVPTGVYDGKMWRRQALVRGPDGWSVRPQTPEQWFLCWYGPSVDPTKCAVYAREILLV